MLEHIGKQIDQFGSNFKYINERLDSFLCSTITPETFEARFNPFEEMVTALLNKPKATLIDSSTQTDLQELEIPAQAAQDILEYPPETQEQQLIDTDMESCMNIAFDSDHRSAAASTVPTIFVLKGLPKSTPEEIQELFEHHELRITNVAKMMSKKRPTRKLRHFCFTSRHSPLDFEKIKTLQGKYIKIEPFVQNRQHAEERENPDWRKKKQDYSKRPHRDRKKKKPRNGPSTQDMLKNPPNGSELRSSPQGTTGC